MIRIIQNLEPLFEVVDHALPDTLFVFDVDFVIAMPGNPFLQAATQRDLSRYVDGVLQGLSPEEVEICYTLMSRDPMAQLVDPAFLDLMALIYKKRHRAIALTAILAGTWQKLDSVKTRYQALKRLGVDFSKSFPDLERWELRELPSFLGAHPTFHRGILCSNGLHVEKGTVLHKFCSEVGWPNAVVFVDDLHFNLLSVQKVLEKERISHSLWHYTAAASLTPNSSLQAESVREHWQQLADQARILLATEFSQK